MSANVPASIKARLLNRAKASHEEFELSLVRYACERFLYRLGESPLRDRCVLKGAGLLTLWTGDPYRATGERGERAPRKPTAGRALDTLEAGVLDEITGSSATVGGRTSDLDRLRVGTEPDGAARR